MNSYFKSQFIHFTLIWMNHNCENNRKINWFHKKCSRNICNDKQSLFNKVLD